MASQDFDASTAPQDIVAALSLAAGTVYSGQNVSTFATLRVREAASVPASTARAYKVEAGGQFTISPKTGEGIYVWTDESAGCAVIVTESP